MEKFFTFINRFNSLLIFGGLLVLAAIFLWALGSSFERDKRDVVTRAGAPASKETLDYRLVEFTDIPGANAQMLKLTASKAKAGIAYSNYESDTRNILFLSGDEKAARWLFPNQHNVIHTAAQLTTAADEERPGRNKITQALYFVYADRDTNGDGEITQRDRSKIGLSKANGEGFTTVLNDIDHVYSVSLIGDRSISILYRVGKPSLGLSGRMSGARRPDRAVAARKTPRKPPRWWQRCVIC